MPQELPSKTAQALSYKESVLKHFHHKGFFVLLDYKGRTYAGLLQSDLSCKDLAHVIRLQQPLSCSLVSDLLTFKDVSRYAVADNMSLEKKYTSQLILLTIH